MNWLPNRRTRRVLAILLGLDVLLIGLLLVAYWGIARGQPKSLAEAGLVLVSASGASQNEGLDDYGEAPSWTLTDQMGRQVSSEQVRQNQAYVYYPNFTEQEFTARSSAASSTTSSSVSTGPVERGETTMDLAVAERVHRLLDEIARRRGYRGAPGAAAHYPASSETVFRRNR